jgi:M6 family metalloprotease-like protein
MWAVTPPLHATTSRFMSHRRAGVAIVLGLSLIAAGALTAVPANAATPKPGAACKPLGKKVVTAGKRYTCVKSKGRQVWSAGVKVKATASASPRPVVPTPTPTLPAAPTGLVTVSATECQLPEVARRGDVGLGFPRAAVRMPTTGKPRAVVLFVDFPDAQAQETTQQTLARISEGTTFFSAVSYGRLDLQLDAHPVWLRMSKPSGDYSFERGLTFALHRDYIREAVSLADPAVNFSGASAVYVMANPQARKISFGPAFTAQPGWGVTADGTTIFNGVTSGYDLNNWGFIWLNHEVGHTMTLVDLYAFDGTSQESNHRFVGDWSFMGDTAGRAWEPLAYERWLLGWLDNEQISCATAGSGDVVLTPIERRGGSKAVMVRTGNSTAVLVESRRKEGYDSKSLSEGLLVYTVDTAIRSGEGPVVVQSLRANDPSKSQAPLRPGETLTIGKVTITHVSSSADGDTVTVTVAP